MRMPMGCLKKAKSPFPDEGKGLLYLEMFNN